MINNEEALLNKRQEGWARLNELSHKAEGSFRYLSGDEVVEYVRLYRQASADLAYLMTHSSNADVVHYLNALVGRSYAQLYRTPKKGLLANLWEYLATICQTIRRQRRSIYLASALFFAAMIFAWGYMTMDPSARRFFVPPGFESAFDHWKSGVHPERTDQEGALASVGYATHNPTVAIMATSLSVATFGYFAVYSMWQNGAIIGALAAEVSTTGNLPFLFCSIAPHGISEIGGFIIAAAAGLIMGGALLSPGRRSRGEALRIAGKDAMVMFVIAIIMIFLAAPIEGYFSFNPKVPLVVKAVFAIAAFAAWMALFIGFGKSEEELVQQTK